MERVYPERDAAPQSGEIIDQTAILLEMRVLPPSTALLFASLQFAQSLISPISTRRHERTLAKLQAVRSTPQATTTSYRRSAKSGNSGSSERYPKNLSQEQRRQESLDAGHNPLLSLNLNLDALARAQAPARAQELYQRISALHREGYYAVSPDIVSFNSVLKAWQTDPEKALEFWEAEAGPGRNVRSYNTFLLALANAGMYEQAESLLRQMQVINAAVRPDRISWNTVLLAYATAISEEDPDVAEKADALLREMMRGGDDCLEQAENDNKHDLMSLPPVVDPDYVPHTPDAISFNTVISTWSAHPNPKEAAKKSEYWLREMKAMDGIHPDVYTYTTVLKAWSRCGGAVAAERALELLGDMQETKYAQPNRITYTVVMRTLCQNQQPDKADRILQTMLETPEIRPDCVAFSVLMDGWAAYTKARAAVKDEAACRKAVISVQQLLGQMKELSKHWPDMAPNERTYTSVLKTFATSQLFDAGILAHQILAEMWDSKTTLPSTIHYNAALDCCAKVPRATKAVDAANLWREMLDAGIPCDTITYNTIISAAANSFGTSELKQQSFQIGQDAFDALQADESCRPTSLTFNYYFKMTRKLLPRSSSDTLKLVKTALELCCDEGCLNEILLRQLVKSATDQEVKFLLGDQFARSRNMLDLPAEWSRNAMGNLNRLRD